MLFRQIFIVDNGQNIEEIIQPIGHTASVVIFGPPFMKPIEAEFTKYCNASKMSNMRRLNFINAA